ncbi:hypothetical protein EMCRGX_G028811 [Ephydatia muelleri]
MAYIKGPTTELKYSVSPIPGNLDAASFSVASSSDGNVAYVVIHKNIVNIAFVSGGVCTQEQAPFDAKNSFTTITQAKWCFLRSGRKVLVLTSHSGIKFMAWNGSSLLHYDPIETPADSYDQRYAKGVATINDTVCVGTSDGPIKVFNVGADGSVVFVRQLQGHTAPICDVCTDGGRRLASSDERGTIIVWSNPVMNAESEMVITGKGDTPCTCLGFWQNMLIGGFGNGKICIYNSENGRAMVEILAHGRWINSLDVSENGMLLSVAEDCVASVWSLPRKEDPKVHLVFSVTMTDHILCGGKFCDPQAKQFAITAYDVNDIMSFVKAN